MSAMETKKYLYLIVSSYPYGHAEPFLETELRHIHLQFEKVYIVIPDYKKLKNPIQRFWMPENSELIKIDNKKKSTFLVSYFLKLLKKSILEEIYHIKFSFGLKIRLIHLRSILAFSSAGDSFREEFMKILNAKGHAKSETTIYSYWLTDAVWGIAQIKKQFPQLNVCSRVHGWDCFFHRDSNNYLPLRKEILNTLDFVCPVSKDGRDYLLSKIPNINPDKIRLHYLGVDESLSVADILFREGKLRIVSIAYVHHVKRLHLLIEALSLIDDVEIEWTHIGAWSEATTWHKQYAIDLLHSKKNIKFKIAGEFTVIEVRNYLDNHNADFLINVSESEGLPVSMMESLAAGVPVISTAVGGVPEIISHKYNGFLMPSNPNSEEISRFLLEVSKIRRAEYEAMSLNARSDFETKWKASKNFDIFAKSILIQDNHKNNLLMTFKICSKCIVDSIIHPDIVLNEEGVCDICLTYDRIKISFENEKKEFGENYLHNKISEISRNGKNKKYDCILGLSGGVDSSYLAVKVLEWGLKPLVIHIDNGWNTEAAVLNINKICRHLGLDLETYVVNWEEIRDLELAYMAASVVDIDIPNEMCSQAILYRMAAKFNVKYIITGHNHVSEGWLPPSFSHYKYDTLNLRDIHRKFGKVKLKTYPTIGFFRTQYYSRLLGIEYFSPLNYIDYHKENAKKLLIEKFQWKDYGGKHHENIYTRFYQSYILPQKFNLDKRKAHLSSLICAGQLSRDEALEIIKKPLYANGELLQSDRSFFIKKLGLTESEFNVYIQTKPIKHTAYKSYMNIYSFLRKIFYFWKLNKTK